MDDYQRVQERIGRILGKKIFFIIGLTRSGTGWIQQAIDAHSQVRCEGEGHFTDILYPMMGRMLGGYNGLTRRARERLQAAGGRGRSADLTNGDLRHLLTTAMGLVLSRWVGDRDVQCIGEKTPEHVHAPELLERLVPGARFVHVIRDGRDEAVSIWEFNKRVGGKNFSKKFPEFALFAEAFAANWNAGVGRAHAFGRANRDRYLEIRSENLHDEPLPAVLDLIQFLGLDESEAEVARCVEAGMEGAVSGAGAGQWRRYFDSKALGLFNRNAGELLKLLEYED